MKIEHIAMYVNDLEAARDFFVKFLDGHSNDGYHNKTTDFRSYFICFDGGARLEIMTKPKLENQDKPLNRTGYAHIAFSVGSKEKVDELTERLKSDGFEVSFPFPHAVRVRTITAVISMQTIRLFFFIIKTS